jgi:amino acid adenylation domain-containing protein
MTTNQDLLQQIAQLPPEKRAQLLAALRAQGVTLPVAPAPAPTPIPPADRTLPIPLAFPQEQLWFLQQLQPASAAYNERLAVRLLGALDVAGLEQALHQVVQRHASLRTAFVLHSATDATTATPVQVIRPFVADEYRLLQPLPPPSLPPEGRDSLGPRDNSLTFREGWGGAETTLTQQSDALTLQPFDLTQAPLWRLALFQTGAQEHVLLLVVHHIIADAWSMAIFLQELAAAYSAFQQGQSVQLPSLPVTYADFAAWQRQTLQGERLIEHLDFWRQSLQGAPLILQLPADHPRPPVPSGRGGVVRFGCNEALTQSLKQVSRQHQATLYQTLLSAFALLLYRYTAQEELVIGSVQANRPYAALEPVIGHFVNTLALRTHLQRDATFAELLHQVRTLLEQSHEHQALPFQHIVQALQPERTLGHHPIYQVSFNLHNQPGLEQLSFAGVQVVPLTLENQTSKLDLYLLMYETQGQLNGELEYNRDLFEAATIERLAGHFQTLLTAIVAQPEQPIGDLPLLTPAERHQLLVEWNETTTDYPSDKCIHQLFEEQVARTPDAVAVIADFRFPILDFGLADAQAEIQNPKSKIQNSLTYRELNARANQLAHYLQGLGVGPEVLVGICVERSLEMVVGLLAILKAGGAYVPLDPTYPQERLAFMLQDSDVAVLLTQTALQSSLPPTNAKLVWLDGADAPFATQATDNPISQVQAENLAYVIYTSGSTGQPKGVQIPHGSLTNFLWAMQQQPGFAATDRLLSVTTLSFDIAGLELYLPLLKGGQLVLADQVTARDGGALANLITAQAVTVMQATPATWRLLLAAGWCGAPHLKLLCGGEALPLELARALCRYGGELWNMYGPTETTIWSLMQPIHPQDEQIVIGRPIANTTVYVLDQTVQPVPVGVVGELYIGGTGVARGYLNRPGLTAERFIANPFGAGRLYKTGDLARWLPDGTIEYLGRIDHQVKLRGFRIELGEIEAVLAQYPAVHEAVVIAREDAPGEKRLVAYIIPDKETRRPEPVLRMPKGDKESGPDALAVSELRSYLQSKLPEYMVPSAFVLLDALPLTPNGKVDRKALPAPQAASVASAALQAPRTAVEATLVAIWREVLGVAVGIEENFFAVGGHSLLATQVVARIRRDLAVELSLRTLFATPTVAGLAGEVARLQASHQAAVRPPLLPVARRGRLPVSYAQQRMWFLAQMEGSDRAYHIPLLLELAGTLDTSALARSWEALVERHEVLRTCYALVEGEVVQVMREEVEVSLAVAIAPDDCDQTLAAWAQAESGRPFDLAHELPWRLALLQVAPERHLLLLTLHHIAADGWSLGVLAEEWRQHYTALTTSGGKQLAVLPPLAIQYADYAHWQRQWLQGETLAQQAAYWRQHLAGAPALLELPTDYPRPAVQSYRGAVVEFTLPADLVQGVQRLSAQQGVTLFMTLLAAFKVLLHRYSGQTELVVGTPIANRTMVESEALIGMMVNTLALRSQIDGAQPFCAFLAQVRSVTQAAYDHQDIPFEMVVEYLQPERSLSHAPLFQALFVLQNNRQVDFSLPGVQSRWLPPPSETTKFDLTLALFEEAGELLGSWEYNTDLFEAATIERLAGHFQTLLTAIVAQPEQPIGDLPLLTAAERHQLLVEWNETTTDYPSDKCIHHLFEEQVARTPDAVAVIADFRFPILDFGLADAQAEIQNPKSKIQNSLTYRELNARANQLAHYLRTLGIGPEVLVGICVERSIEMVVGLLAILKTGGAYVPLDPSYPQERLAFMLQDSDVAVLLTQTALHTNLPPTDAKLVCLDAADALFAGHATDNPVSQVQVANLAYVIYTSGSTGQPKGVLLEHRGLVNLAQAQIRAFGVQPGSRVLQVASLNFDASISEIVMALCAGATLVVAPAEQLLPGFALSATIQRTAISHITLVPSSLTLLDPEEVPALQRVIVAGEACSPPLAARWAARLQFFNAYGPTETTVCATIMDCATWQDRQQAPPIGRPLANTQLYLLDAQQRLVPLGVAGELHIGGAGVARGYLNRQALTAERFIANPFGAGRLYKTGDLARWRPDGNIEYLGRIDHQVKLRGFRIELGEIEAVLAQHPDVHEAVVIAREDAPGEKRLVAYIVADKVTRWQGDGSAELAKAKVNDRDDVTLSPHHPVTLSALRQALAQRLPDYMMPSAFVFLDALPLTPNGKVDRKALPTPKRQMEHSSVTRPRTLAEQQLVRIWEDLLAIHPIGIEDRFFDLGGHSLLAVQLLAKIQHAFGQTLPLRTLFAHPTIAELAMALQQGTIGTITTSLVALQPRGDRAPLYCLPGAGGGVLYLYQFAQALGDQQPVYALESLGLDGKTPPFTTVEAAAAYQVQQLQGHQPQGPYHLAGHSYGGFVVYAMAQQLHKAGAAIGALCILDTGAPTGKAQPMDEVGIILLYERLFLEEYGLAPTLSETQLLPLTSEERLLAFKAALEAAKILPANSDLDQVRGIVNVVAADLQAAAYLPSDFVRLPIHLFVATDDERSAEATQALIDGWRHYGEVTVHETPGTHTTMMYPPHVQVLAEKVNAVLQGQDAA